MIGVTRWSWFLAVLVGIASGQARARPCPPCVETTCIGDEEAARAYAAKRARLLASEAPPRLVDSLLARTAQCEYCLRGLPDALHIMLEYPNGNRWTFGYSRFDEKLARQELRSGKIKAFHIFIASDACACCARLEPRQDPATGLIPAETDSFNAAGSLGPDPPDLEDVGQPPPYVFPPDLPHPAKVEPACPDCATLAAERNRLAEDAWSAEHTHRRHKAEQQWDYRRATYALDRGDSKAGVQAIRAARDWQVKVDQAGAELSLARLALAKADAALAECTHRCPRPTLAPAAPLGWRPSGSLDLRLGPALVAHAAGNHQLAIGVSLRLRVLPRDLPGYLTVAPFIAVLGGFTTIGVPIGFQYDVEVARRLFLYGRLGLGYAARLFVFGSSTTRLDAALLLPEAGARYELRDLPLNLGVDLVSLPLYLDSSGVDVYYSIMLSAGYRLGR